MLRADLLAFSAFEAVACLAVFQRADIVIIVIGVPIVIHSLGVERGEEVWNQYFLRTSFDAITASGARNEMFSLQQSANFPNGLLLCLV